MKQLACSLGLLWLLSPCGAAIAADAELQSFENAVYGISEISHFGGDPAELGRLSAESRSEVIHAKSILVNVLKSLQDKNIKSHMYLTETLAKKFPTEQSFARSLLDPETSLLALLVNDFTFSANNAQIVFEFSLVMSSEGSLATADKSATLIKVGPDWKFASIQ